jgi:hypothetical protein
MRYENVHKAIKKLTPDELRRAIESINHGMGKTEYELPELLPRLIDGHHQISSQSAQRIKSALRKLSAEELGWMADNADRLVRDD